MSNVSNMGKKSKRPLRDLFVVYEVLTLRDIKRFQNTNLNNYFDDKPWDYRLVPLSKSLI